VRAGKLLLDGSTHLGRLVADDLPPHDLVPFGEELVKDCPATRVGRLGARVADREDVAVDGRWRGGLVLDMADGWSIATPQPFGDGGLA
jgi:hypothetical protein